MRGEISTSTLKSLLLVLIAAAVILGIIAIFSGKSTFLLDKIKDLLTFGL